MESLRAKQSVTNYVNLLLRELRMEEGETAAENDEPVRITVDSFRRKFMKAMKDAVKDPEAKEQFDRDTAALATFGPTKDAFEAYNQELGKYFLPDTALPDYNKPKTKWCAVHEVLFEETMWSKHILE